LLAVERRSAPLLGLAFGLLLLAAEPVTLVGAVLAVAIAAWRRMPIGALATAVVLAALIAAPQLIAFAEISGEIERTAGLRPATVLATALSPLRVAELFVWPFSGFLNDPGGGAARLRLFSTIFIGIIALPALVRRSRFVIIALTMLFLASANPLVVMAVLRFEWLRFGRFPEKFVIPLAAALVVLIGEYFDRTRARRVWAAITLLPLLWFATRALPIDWFSPYRVTAGQAHRVVQFPDARTGVEPARIEYRKRARRLEPLFGMTAGVTFLMMASPDSMQSRLAHIVIGRFHTVSRELRLRYLQICGASVPGALPEAVVVPRTIAARSLQEAVADVESPSFDPHQAAVAPVDFISAPARVTGYARRGQTITIDVDARGPVLVMVNQTYFASWVPTMNGETLPIVSLNIDRLGILVPGSGRVVLRFGRYRLAVAASAAMSVLLVLAIVFRELIEKRDRGAGQVERAGDHDAALG
jgi:hypothetical protein